MTSRVSFRRCDTYEDAHDVLNELLLPFEKYFSKGDAVLVKPNMLSPRKPEEAVTTHPKVLEAVLKFLLDLGTAPVVGDSPASGTAMSVAKKAGIHEVCERLNVPILNLNDPVETNGKVYQKIKISETAITRKVVNIAKLKTHSQMVMTLGVKNTFGCVVGMEKAGWHLRAGTNERFADLLIDVHLVVSPVITIMDGIEGMEGNGPANGVKKHFGLLAVSDNAFALDYAIVEALNVDPEIVYTVKRSMDRGLIPEFVVDGEWKGEIKLPSTVPVVPVPKPLQNLARRFVRVPKIDVNRCVRCRICENTCPAGAINIDRTKIDYSKCIRCYVCHEVCPEDAIMLVRKFLMR